MVTGSQKVDGLKKTAVMATSEWTRTNGNIEKLTFGTEFVLTFSFHSRTHFSIHGTKLITTNSRANLAVCWMSPSAMRNVFRAGPAGTFGVRGDLTGVPSDVGGGGRCGRRAGTGTGGGEGVGRARGRR